MITNYMTYPKTELYSVYDVVDMVHVLSNISDIYGYVKMINEMKHAFVRKHDTNPFFIVQYVLYC